MKKVLLITILILFIGCKQSKPVIDRYTEGYEAGFKTASTKDSLKFIAFQDSMKILNTSLVDKTNTVKSLTDSIEKLQAKVDSLSKIGTTIEFENYIAKKKLVRIKYYIKICDNKPSNKKFFFGWVKRTIRQ
jgi:hypothetical protein